MPSPFKLLLDTAGKYAVIAESVEEGVYQQVTPMWSRQSADEGLKNLRKSRLCLDSNEAYAKAHAAAVDSYQKQTQMILDFEEEDKDNDHV